MSPDTEKIEKVVVVPLHEVEEKGIVIVHCHYEGEGAVRIWRSTFLIDQSGAHRSRLLHVENVSLAPQWTLVGQGVEHHFTLYFEGLPKSCKVFDLHEIIPQPGGFFIADIVRNQEDVYRIEIL
ncbi:MAG: hypothetical protein IPP71_02185 [Bacteroidetes bacterium]|nr:hypothetical protein [Bacteroidota bacterium]